MLAPLEIKGLPERNKRETSTIEGRVVHQSEQRDAVQALRKLLQPGDIIMLDLAAALFARFESQGESVFADKVLSAMRYAFAGHAEKKS